MDYIHEISIRIDAAIARSRLNAFAQMMNIDRSDRLATISGSLSHLAKGFYLIGTGPSTNGIYPICIDEINIGRKEMPGEKPCDISINCHVNDNIYYSPFEVSKAHAKIVRIKDGKDIQHHLIDLYSTCGTFLNSERLDPDGAPRMLKHMDLISLGSLNISTYLFVEIL